MADFRKMFFALSAAAFFIGTASAQNAFTCTSNAGVPPLVRSQGLTESVGDVVLNCTGGVPTPLTTPTATPVPQNNVQIFLNTNVTSRLLAGSTTLSEALLMIDEPTPAQQRVCTPGPCAIYGQAATPQAAGINYASTAGIPNVYQGTQAAANSISWLGVPIDPPGSTGTRIIRITNIRANANQLGVSSTLIPTQIVMFISVTGNSQVAINNPQQTVAYIQNGLTFSVFAKTSTSTSGVPVGLQQCVNNNSAQATDNTSGTTISQTLNLSFKEAFATAFKIAVLGGKATPTAQNAPGTSYNTESAFYSPTWTAATSCSGAATANCYTGSGATTGNLTNAGLADSGTKLIARFNNVPAGIVLYVSVSQNTGSSTGAAASLISTDAFGANGSLPNSIIAPTNTAGGGLAAGGTAGYAPVTLNNGTGAAVWEVSAANSQAIDTLNFNMFVSYVANPAANLPGLGASTINGTFAPLSTVTTASSGPIPRFADTSTATAGFNITACSTNILFPFLTNQAGFDSGVSIANTSADPFGTAAQAGPCTLNYYGGTTGGGAAPAAQKSGVVNAGTLLLFTLSGGGNLGIAATPGFQGYMIAQCNFQYAHGFAFISDVGANKVSEAYLGLIMDTAMGSRTGNMAEVLAH